MTHHKVLTSAVESPVEGTELPDTAVIVVTNALADYIRALAEVRRDVSAEAIRVAPPYCWVYWSEDELSDDAIGRFDDPGAYAMYDTYSAMQRIECVRMEVGSQDRVRWTGFTKFAGHPVSTEWLEISELHDLGVAVEDRWARVCVLAPGEALEDEEDLNPHLAGRELHTVLVRTSHAPGEAYYAALVDAVRRHLRDPELDKERIAVLEWLN